MRFQLTCQIGETPRILSVRRDGMRLKLSSGKLSWILEWLIQKMKSSDRNFRCTQCTH
jgi:hypothetical protein